MSCRDGLHRPHLYVLGTAHLCDKHYLFVFNTMHRQRLFALAIMQCLFLNNVRTSLPPCRVHIIHRTIYFMTHFLAPISSLRYITKRPNKICHIHSKPTDTTTTCLHLTLLLQRGSTLYFDQLRPTPPSQPQQCIPYTRPAFTCHEISRLQHCLE